MSEEQTKPIYRVEIVSWYNGAKSISEASDRIERLMNKGYKPTLSAANGTHDDRGSDGRMNWILMVKEE